MNLYSLPFYAHFHENIDAAQLVIDRVQWLLDIAYKVAANFSALNWSSPVVQRISFFRRSSSAMMQSPWGSSNLHCCAGS